MDACCIYVKAIVSMFKPELSRFNSFIISEFYCSARVYLLSPTNAVVFEILNWRF